MKLNCKTMLSSLALLAMALPLWAHTDSIQYVVTQSTTIAGYRLAPGSYQLKANDATNTVTVQLNGSIVTQVPCKFVQLPQKAGQTEVLSNGSKVTGLHFSGKTEAVAFNS